MLCDAEGRPYAEAGFPDEMTPESMGTVLESQMKIKVKRDGAFAKADKAEGLEKAKLLIAALDLVPPASVSSAYGSTIDQIAKLDPEDSTGFVQKARSEKALAQLEAGFGEMMGAEKFDDAIKLVDSFIEEQSPKGEAKQKAMLFKVFGLATKEEFKKAIAVTDEILAIDGSTETAGMAKQVKRQLENQ
ncbi:MAG: hypothetical protein ACR2RV_17630 [Verrucomicrobiales bacterium]